ncbi:MAG: hypothetical protein WCG73_03635, partial [Candidatus Moraniibacteriota bacterium]
FWDSIGTDGKFYSVGKVQNFIYVVCDHDALSWIKSHSREPGREHFFGCGYLSIFTSGKSNFSRI